MDTNDLNLPQLEASSTPRLLRNRELLHSTATRPTASLRLAKAVEVIHEVHLAVSLADMKATSLPVGLIMNFAEPTLCVRRVGREGSAMNGKSRKAGVVEDFIGFPT